jgi:hypothetical protein
LLRAVGKCDAQMSDLTEDGTVEAGSRIGQVGELSW